MKRRKHLRIDWERVKQQLKQNELALHNSLTADRRQLDEMYGKRAREFALRRTAVPAHARNTPVLVFSLGAERYGIALDAVLQVRPFNRCAPVPGSAVEVLGVVNQQDELRTVVDLRRLLELPDRDDAAHRYILLVRHGDSEIGFCVDDVDQVQRIAADLLVEPDDVRNGIDSRFLQSVTPGGVIVLDIEAIFAHAIFSKAPLEV